MAPPSPPSVPRPPSRSERLLRDTLRRDDTRRTYGSHSSRPRSASSSCDDDDDEDFFQSAILSRSSRRNSAASALGHPHGPPPGFYIPDQNEHASYSQLLRSSSYSGSSRSGRSDPKTSPRPAYMQEKQVELLRHHDAAPHEAVLRNRLDSVMHSMRIDKDRDPVDALTHVQSPTTSLASSLGSASNSRAYSHESYQTHLTVPDPDQSVSPASRPKRASPRTHRHTQSASVVHASPTSPRRTSASPRVPTQSPRSLRASHSPRSPPQTPTSQKGIKCLQSDSPWMYTPLPPSPPAFSSKHHGGPAVVTFVATPPMVDAHTHLPTRSPDRRSTSSSSSFDPEAASHALRQLPGYVSFSSVAGLGTPPEEEDRRSGRRPFNSFTIGGGKGRLSGLGLGSGKWWIF